MMKTHKREYKKRRKKLFINKKFVHIQFCPPPFKITQQQTNFFGGGGGGCDTYICKLINLIRF